MASSIWKLGPVLSEILPYIASGEPIPLKLILNAFHRMDGLWNDTERRRLANEIWPTAGDFLPIYALEKFISANLSENEAKLIVRDRKKFFQRIGELLPLILKIIDIKDDGSAASILVRVDEINNDFPLIDKSEHKKVKIKKARLNTKEIKNRLPTIINHLENIDWKLNLEFSEHVAARIRHYSDGGGQALYDIGSLIYDLKQLKFTNKVYEIREKIDSLQTDSGNSGSRTYIVECAYSLFLQYGKPKFVTTPGSEFSLLCSLLLELASGIPEESFAGAIAKFARSEARKKLDADHALTDWENSDEAVEQRIADNFAHINDELLRLSEEYKFWIGIQSQARWDKFELGQIEIRIYDTLEQIKEARSKNGPFIVFVDQLNTGSFSEKIREIESADSILLKLRAEIGRLKRDRLVDPELP